MGRRSREKRQRRQEAASRRPEYSAPGFFSPGHGAVTRAIPYALIVLVGLILILEKEVAIVGVLPGALLVLDRSMAFLRAWLARDWEQTTATIRTSAVHRDPHVGDDHIFWSPVITYEYEVNGVFYTGKRISLTGHGVRNSAGGATRQALYRLGVGERVQVWYNPEDPRQAALYRHLGISSWLVFAVGVALLGISAPRLIEVFSR